MPFPFTLAGGNRFANDFTLTAAPPPPAATAEEQALHARMERVLTDLADLQVAADHASYGRHDSERGKLAKSLHDAIDDVVNGSLTAQDALLGTYEQWGRYLERCAQIDDCVFFVQGLDTNGDPVAGRTGFEDILYLFGNGPPTAEQVKLKGDVDRVLSVVREIVPPTNTQRQRKRSDYIRELVGVAKSGLEFNQIALGNAELESFKTDFVLREAGALKNSYVKRLGFWGVMLGAVAGIAWTAIDFNFKRSHHPGVLLSLLQRFDNMLLISLGAACGAWLAFLINRPTLTFDGLTNLDEDLLRPSSRMIYTMLLAPVVGLLFWTRMVTVSIDGFTSNVWQSGTVGLLVGVLCGIASRGVATAVGQRAGDFAGLVGGTATPAK